MNDQSHENDNVEVVNVEKTIEIGPTCRTPMDIKIQKLFLFSLTELFHTTIKKVGGYVYFKQFVLRYTNDLYLTSKYYFLF